MVNWYVLIIGYSLHLFNFMLYCFCRDRSGNVIGHILYVLKKRNVEILLDHYILPRWTLDSRYKRDNFSIGLEDTHTENGRYGVCNPILAKQLNMQETLVLR